MTRTILSAKGGSVSGGKFLYINLMVLAFAFAQMAPADPTNRYVVKNNPTPLSPFTNWADAATNIQDAINASYASDTVWVSNGVYDVGGMTNYPSGTVLTNRVVINKAITVRSANNDPTNTIIKGAWDPATNGPAAVRCVYMVNNSSLIGFTLTNGATLAAGAADDTYGGGVYCPTINTVISNCVLTGNSAFYYGGGAIKGTLFNCTLAANSSTYGGGAIYATLFNCTLTANSAVNTGGGVNDCTLNNCTLTSNLAVNGGGAGYCTLFNSTLTSNSAVSEGGGAYYGTLTNCTLTGNSANFGGGASYANLYNCALVGNSVSINGGGAYAGTRYNCTIVGNQASSLGGGVYEGVLYNSIIYFNTAPDGTNWYGAVSFTNSCTTTNQPGWAPGNITADPIFIANGSGYGTNHVAGNYRLSADSPCLNAGTNFAWMTDPNDVRSKDLDGLPRIRYGIVDMGAYETLHKGTIFYIH